MTSKEVSSWEVKVEKINSALEYQKTSFERMEEEIRMKQEENHAE